MKKVTMFSSLIAGLALSFAASAETWNWSHTLWAGPLIVKSRTEPGPIFLAGSLSRGTEVAKVNATAFIINGQHVNVTLTFPPGNDICNATGIKTGLNMTGTMTCNTGGGELRWNANISPEKIK